MPGRHASRSDDPGPAGPGHRQAAEQVGLTRSQLVQEAVALYLKAVMEVRNGRRLAVIDRKSKSAVVELTSPALTQLEWLATGETIDLFPAAAERLAALVAKPPAPTPALMQAVRRRRCPRRKS
jgi:uncharacterized protein (DUF1778 family)